MRLISRTNKFFGSNSLDIEYLTPSNLTCFYEHRLRGVVVALVLIKNECLLPNQITSIHGMIGGYGDFSFFPPCNESKEEKKLCGIILFGRSVNGSPCSTKTSVMCANKGVAHIVNDGSLGLLSS